MKWSIFTLLSQTFLSVAKSGSRPNVFNFFCEWIETMLKFHLGFIVTISSMNQSVCYFFVHIWDVNEVMTDLIMKTTELECAWYATWKSQIYFENYFYTYLFYLIPVLENSMETEHDTNRRISSAAASRLAAQEQPPPLPARPGRAQRQSPICSTRENRRPAPPPVTVAPTPIPIHQIQVNRQRRQNDYVGLPPLPPPPRPPPPKSKGNTNRDKININTSVAIENRLNLDKERENLLQKQDKQTTIVTQPVSQQGVTTIKEGIELDHEHGVQSNNSIICRNCGKCKCKSCVDGPKKLPSYWCGSNDVKYECSATNCVEAVTCLKLVKCCFYHCYKDSEQDLDISSADKPCACCTGPHCCKRWTSMLMCSLCVPCLCLYPPLMCCLKGATCIYNRCARKGCQCRNRHARQDVQTKGLLIESESSSTWYIGQGVVERQNLNVCKYYNAIIKWIILTYDDEYLRLL